ncbi:MAG: AMP-binding protein, partial [Deltaproteobacteria bacterium]|nr:AMP-binding protein [Deltaproteobacteria bacterium]
ETEKVIIDGWLRTGDIGEIDNDGFLKITGRIKDLIVLSTGKNIAPQLIETAVARDHYIEQIAVFGDSRKYISAIVVPCFEALEEYARGRGLKWTTWVELTELPEITNFYMERIDVQSRGLAGFEKIKKFYIHSEEFSQKRGELTPTLKTRRMEVMKKYKDQIEAMYN